MGRGQLAINRHANAGRDKDHVTNGKLRHRDRLGLARVDALGGLDLKCGQFFGRRTGGVAGVVVKVSTDQQKKCQRQGCVKIGMRATVHHLVEGHARSQQDRQRYRDIHVQCAHAQGGPRAGKEGLSAEQHRRKGNHGRDQVKQITRCIRGTGPDCNGKQHDVHHGKSGHREPDQQHTPQRIPFGLQQTCIKGKRLIADLFEHRDQLIHISGCGADCDTFQRQVYAGIVHAGCCHERAFDFADASGAMDAGQGQKQVWFSLGRCRLGRDALGIRDRIAGGAGRYGGHFITRTMMRC